MANQYGRPVTPARKVVAAVLGTLAAFVVVYGAGLASWPVVALGLIVLALSVALGMVNVVRRGARAWVAGTAQVKAASPAPLTALYGRAELKLVVVAPGLPVAEVLVRDPRVPVDKWPRLDVTLPVTVDVDDMRRVRIDWANAPDNADQPRAPEPAESPESEPTDDLDLLGGHEPPPWATHTDVGAGPATASVAADRVVVRETPEGAIVEGQLVGADDSPAPLPRRGTRSGPTSSVAASPGARPSPRPRPSAGGTATATVESEPVRAVDWSGDERAEAATPTPPVDLTPPAPAPAQREAPRVDHDIDVPLDSAGDLPTGPDDGGLPGAAPRPDAGHLIPPPRTAVEETGERPWGPPAGRRTDRSGPIHGVGLTVLCTDLNRSVEFYRDILGFTELDRGTGNVVLASGDTRVLLREVVDLAAAGRLIFLNLEVGDVQATYRDLSAKGVTFEHAPQVVNRGDKLELWSATFHDPDGHNIAVTQWRSAG